MSKPQICIAVTGLGFGAEFVPIYQRHPDVREVVLCDPDEGRLRQVGDRYEVRRRFADLDALLDAPDIDAVHLLTPLFFHAEQTMRVLRSGRHCACAVTMGVTLDELHSVIAAQRASGKNYMMMETVVYSREFLFVKDLYDRGEMGELTFLRGVYFQDVEGYPAYWRSVPPMHYATHAVAPAAGAGRDTGHAGELPRLRPAVAPLAAAGGEPLSAGNGLFRLENTPVAAEVTRSWFETARPYIEGFHVYGTKTRLRVETSFGARSPPCSRWATSARPMAGPSRRPASSSPTSPTDCPRRSGSSRSTRRTAPTAGHTRTWPTSSCGASLRAVRPPLTP